MAISVTYVGALVSLLAGLAQLLNWDIDQGQLTEFVTALMTVVGFLVTLWGRFRAGGVTWTGVKK